MKKVLLIIFCHIFVKQYYAISTEHEINTKASEYGNALKEENNNPTGAALHFDFSEKCLLKGTYLFND